MNIGTVLDSVGGLMQVAGFSLLASTLAKLIRIDHPMTFEFAVEIDGVVDAGFKKCDGLSDRMTQYEIQEVNQDTPTQISPYQRQFGYITLEKGITFQGAIEDWYYACAEYVRGSKSPRRDISIIQLQRLPKTVPLLGNQLIEIRRWNLRDCVCVDLTYPNYDADKENEISILSCTIHPKSYDKPLTFGQVGLLLDLLKG